MKNSRHFFKKRINASLIFLFLLFLPTQFGKHFFMDFSYINGVKIDYLSLAFYTTDILATALLLANYKIIFFKIKKTAKYLLLLTILIFLNILESAHPILSFYHFIKLAEIYFIFIIFASQKIDFRQISIPLFLGAVVEIALAVFQFINKSSLQGIFYFLGERYVTLSTSDVAKSSLKGVAILRPYATFSHPNSMAGFYLLLYFYFLTFHSDRSIIKYASLLVFSFLILISFSKIAILTYLFLNIIYLFVKRTDCRLCPHSSGIIFVIVSAIFLQPIGDPASVYKRLFLVFDSLNIISKNLLFGVGLGHYLFNQSLFPIKYSYFFLQPVHNIFLLFFAEAGLILSIPVLYFLIKYIKNNFRDISFSFCFLVFFITGVLDHYWLTLQQNFLLMATVFGLLTGRRN